jgi:peroxiredoxin family protein
MTQKKMALIATKGTLDWAYPPFILASTAASLGYEVQIFFTFYGLQLLRKDISDIKISPLANPAMPMPVPMPVLVQALPGMEAMATMMMKNKMTVDLFEFKKDDFIPQTQFGGAAMFLGFAGDADISLFI